MSYEAITAWAALAAALVAVCAILAEYRRHRASTSIDLALRLDEQFATERMYRNRKAAARSLSKGSPSEACNEIDEIIDYYDGVGFFVRRGTLDEEVAWNFFFSYLYRFWPLVRSHVETERKRDPTLWSDASFLYHRLLKFEEAERRRHNLLVELSEEDLKQFLVEESNLDAPEAA